MAESEVKILTVEAVKSMADLRKAISDTKEALNGMELGSEEYQRTLAELIKEQNLMRGAMNGTTASMDDLKSAADGTSVTYNGLVNSMANMKRELRNLDLSTAEGRARFKELSQEIKNTNDSLKELDEKQGSYVRNVGNYTSGLKNLGDILKQNIPALGGVAQGIDGIDKSVHLLGQQPILGIVGLLAPLLTQIVTSLKESDDAMAGINKIMTAMKPVMDFFSGVLQQVVEFLGDIIGKASDFLGSSGIFQKIVQGVVGVGNAILQFVIAPIKQTVVAVKGLGNILRDVFTGQWDKIKDDAEAAVKGLNDAFTKGLDFKGNYEAGQEVADKFIAGAKSRKKSAKGAGAELGKEMTDGIIAGMDEAAIEKALSDIDKAVEKQIDETLASIDKATAEANKKAEERAKASIAAVEKNAKREKEINGILTEDAEERAAKDYAIQEETNRKKLSLLERYRDEALDRGDIEANLRYEQEVADLEVEIEMDALRERERLRKKDVEDAKQAAQQKMAAMSAYASGMSGLLGSIADALESGDDASEESVRAAKNLRIAAATIDMISGAVTAFSTAQQLGPIAGPIVGAINAAAVVASGLANIAKIRATNVSKDSAPTSSAPAQATVSAPALETAVPTTTVINGARTETALNRAARPQKVVLVQSEAEAMAEMTRVQVAEASF